MRCQTQTSLGQVKVLFFWWRMWGASGRSDSSVEGRTTAAEGCTGGDFERTRLPDFRRPKSLLLQSCAVILFNYSSWIISGFWRPHTNSRHLSRVGHGKDYFWTILKIGRVILQLMAKRNANLIELLKWNKTNKHKILEDFLIAIWKLEMIFFKNPHIHLSKFTSQSAAPSLGKAKSPSPKKAEASGLGEDRPAGLEWPRGLEWPEAGGYGWSRVMGISNPLRLLRITLLDFWGIDIYHCSFSEFGLGGLGGRFHSSRLQWGGTSSVWLGWRAMQTRAIKMGNLELLQLGLQLGQFNSDCLICISKNQVPIWLGAQPLEQHCQNFEDCFLVNISLSISLIHFN